MDNDSATPERLGWGGKLAMTLVFGLVMFWHYMTAFDPCSPDTLPFSEKYQTECDWPKVLGWR